MGIGLDVESAAFIAAATLPKALLSEPELMLLLVPADDPAFVLVPVALLLPPAMVTALDTDVESEFRLDPPS